MHNRCTVPVCTKSSGVATPGPMLSTLLPKRHHHHSLPNSSLPLLTMPLLSSQTIQSLMSHNQCMTTPSTMETLATMIPLFRTTLGNCTHSMEGVSYHYPVSSAGGNPINNQLQILYFNARSLLPKLDYLCLHSCLTLCALLKLGWTMVFPMTSSQFLVIVLYDWIETGMVGVY